MTEKSESYSIKELANEFDITARTLRHYEELGLLSPERVGQNRVYSAADRVRLAWILRGRRVGFSLAEVGEMIDLYDLGDGRETQRAVTVEKCRARIRDLEKQRDDINETINELQNFAELISNLVRCRKTGQWLRRDNGEPLNRDTLQSMSGISQ